MEDRTDFDHICPYCEIVKSRTARHCVICQRCVERYDHHCPWINNCIGIENHNVFLCLLFSLSFDFICTSIITTFALLKTFRVGEIGCYIEYLDILCVGSNENVKWYVGIIMMISIELFYLLGLALAL